MTAEIVWNQSVSQAKCHPKGTNGTPNTRFVKMCCFIWFIVVVFSCRSNKTSHICIANRSVANGTNSMKNYDWLILSGVIPKEDCQSIQCIAAQTPRRIHAANEAFEENSRKKAVVFWSNIMLAVKKQEDLSHGLDSLAFLASLDSLDTISKFQTNFAPISNIFAAKIE